MYVVKQLQFSTIWRHDEDEVVYQVRMIWEDSHNPLEYETTDKEQAIRWYNNSVDQVNDGKFYWRHPETRELMIGGNFPHLKSAD